MRLIEVPIGVVKDCALKSAQHVERRELFRAGLKVLAAMKENEFLAALATVVSIKTGWSAKKDK